MERFWSKVDRSAGPDGCWPWTGSINKRSGHGRIRVGGKLLLTHRFAYLLEHGEPGACVLHTCDNPPCCNPMHLWLGTAQDNNRDRDEKGRNVNRRGVEHGCARLTEDDVLQIRARCAAGQAQSSVARDYGVVAGNIWHIVNRKTWTHV